MDAEGNASNAGITVSVPDTTAPSIGVISPINGSIVTGLVSVTNTVSDNVGVVKVELYVDGALSAVATAAPWTLTWDTSKGAAGLHTLLTRAYDAAGNSGTAMVTVTASIPDPTGGPDISPPSIGIGYPYNNSTVSGLVKVTNVVSDNVGVVRVEMYVDGFLVTSTLSAPWTLNWNTNWLPRGTHVLVTKAFDAAGNMGSALITVTR